MPYISGAALFDLGVFKTDLNLCIPLISRNEAISLCSTFVGMFGVFLNRLPTVVDFQFLINTLQSMDNHLFGLKLHRGPEFKA